MLAQMAFLEQPEKRATLAHQAVLEFLVRQDRKVETASKETKETLVCPVYRVWTGLQASQVDRVRKVIQGSKVKQDYRYPDLPVVLASLDETDCPEQRETRDSKGCPVYPEIPSTEFLVHLDPLVIKETRVLPDRLAGMDFQACRDRKANQEDLARPVHPERRARKETLARMVLPDCLVTAVSLASEVLRD